jgi:hypothetical protein
MVKTTKKEKRLTVLKKSGSPDSFKHPEKLSSLSVPVPFGSSK